MLRILWYIILLPFRIALLLAVIILGISIITSLILLIYPMVNESAGSPCESLLRRSLYLKYGEVGSAISGRNYWIALEIMKADVRKRTRDWIPPDVVCPLIYLKSFTNKEEFVKGME
jgi:hypothetical protein